MTNQTKDRTAAANRRLAQWRVTWLIEHSTSHQHLWCIDSFVLRNPPLRQAPKRYATPYLNSRTKISKRKKDEQNCQRFTKTKEVQPNAPSQRIAPHLFFPDRTENRTLK